MLRLKAILDCIYFGLVPSCVYENESHYGDSFSDYIHHMKINARVARHWIMRKETPEMVKLAKSKTTYFK